MKIVIKYIHLYPAMRTWKLTFHLVVGYWLKNSEKFVDPRYDINLLKRKVWVDTEI